MQPYSLGISSVHGFNATMSMSKAKKRFRKVEDEPKLFYFNPTWKLMGDNKIVQGTYYNSSDQQEKSIFWYTFDELLIRPYFIDRFNWDYFGIIEKTDNYEKNILIMYSNPETEYPVAITLESSFEEDCEMFMPKYTCDDKSSFESAIAEILSSEHVMKVIQMLYSKAAMLSN